LHFPLTRRGSGVSFSPEGCRHHAVAPIEEERDMTGWITGRAGSRRVAVVAAVATLASLAGLGVAGASLAGADHARRVPPPVAVGPVRATVPSRAAASAGPDATAGSSAPAEFTTTANPITLDPPVAVPATRPRIVTIVKDARFGNAPPPAVSTVELPKGRWATVVLDVTGTESGTQYDRLLEIFDGPSQIFLASTAEPTPAGVTWRVQKNVTGYLPILEGRRTFSTYVDNYLSSVDNGVPTITVRLLFYPAGRGFAPARVASLTRPGLAGTALDQVGPGSPATAAGVPDKVVPLLAQGASNTLVQLNAGQSDTATVRLPAGVTTATLDLYAIGQIGEEFWWSLSPSFRELDVSVDGKPAGIVTPFPYVYTGGVNPLLWRPLTAIHTLDIPSYRIDLTPFAGLMHGPTTVSISVANNTGYWLVGGSLLLTTGRERTTGSIRTDTLTLPGSSTVATSDQLGSSQDQVLTESATRSYRIVGTIRQGRRRYLVSVTSHLTYDNDQVQIDPSCSGPCYQWVQGEATADNAATTTMPSGRSLRQSERSSWTIDAPNGYLTASGGAAFLLPTATSQVLTSSASQVGLGHSYSTSLQESIVGDATLGEDGTTTTAEQGDTTGTVTYLTSTGLRYQRTVVARGGRVLQDVVSASG